MAKNREDRNHGSKRNEKNEQVRADGAGLASILTPFNPKNDGSNLKGDSKQKKAVEVRKMV